MNAGLNGLKKIGARTASAVLNEADSSTASAMFPRLSSSRFGSGPALIAVAMTAATSTAGITRRTTLFRGGRSGACIKPPSGVAAGAKMDRAFFGGAPCAHLPQGRQHRHQVFDVDLQRKAGL